MKARVQKDFSALNLIEINKYALISTDTHISSALNQLKEFDNHQFVIPLYDAMGKVMGFIAIHRGNAKVPAMGATRIWNYPSEKDALVDALRLSRWMSYKLVLAGLSYGGATAVLFDRSVSLNARKKIIKAFAQKVDFFRGGFITGADVGVTDEDLKIMRSESKFVIGVSTDPVKFTALGVYSGIQACMDEVFGSRSLLKKTFAIQGLGKTGHEILRLIYKDASKIFVADIDEKKVARVKYEFPFVEVVPPGDIFKQVADVYIPCALGNTFSVKDVASLQCKVIAGSANNQLSDPKVGDALHKKGILYAPDYVINAGGLIAVVEEYENSKVNQKRILEKLVGIRRRLSLIFAQSKKLNKPTYAVADQMAKSLMSKD